jgi:hypothetical protein
MRILETVWMAILIAVLSPAAIAQTGEGPERKALFGELHMHTWWSFDAYSMSTRLTPDDAYEFAKGKPKKHPNGQTYQISRPLDFMAVTDHSEFMGIAARMADPEHPMSKLPIAKKILTKDRDQSRAAYSELKAASRAGNPVEGVDTPAVRREVWEHVIASANRHYNPGTFTTLIAYEWSSGNKGRNLHRNVFFKGNTAPTPFSAVDSIKPEDLWVWMESVREEGHSVLAVPHNMNASDGIGFDRVDSLGNPLTPEYAATRNRNEPLVEISQIKGTSEVHPALSPNDEFADFELFEQYVAKDRDGNYTPITNFKGSYVRSAYRTGLEFQDMEGFNPYRFGLVAASDSHSGVIPIEENNFSGPTRQSAVTPERAARGRVSSPFLRKCGASGLAGVWSEENTRESIFETLERKETWGTTGPRIQVRVFAGFDMAGVKPGEAGWVKAAYEKGVPMGGELKAADATGAPTFALWAIKDPDTANLDRIQIVKLWSSGGVSHEQIYDAVWSGDRSINPETGKLAPVGNTVNLETLEYSNSIGAVELKGTWTDPKFRADHNAAYYVRVLEIPTPRWSMFDAKTAGIPHPPDVPKTIQERAYTSPIRYDHP